MTRPSYNYKFPRDPSPELAPPARHPASRFILPLTSLALIAVGFVVLAASDARDIGDLSPIRFGVAFVCLLGGLIVLGVYVASSVLNGPTIEAATRAATDAGHRAG